MLKISKMFRTAFLVSVTSVLGLFSVQAHALAVGDAYYLGYVNDGVPSSLANEVGYINDLITLAAGTGDTTCGSETCNREGSTLAGPFPTASETGAVKEDLPRDGDNVINATGYLYVLGKYDATKAGSLVWYLGEGFSGNVTLPTTFNGQGLSHISLFNPGANNVPEPGTLALFGIGLLGAGLARRRRKMQA